MLKSHPFHIRISPEMHAQWKKKAEAANISVGEWIRLQCNGGKK